MTRDQMLTTALEIFNKPLVNYTSEQGDIDGMLEYLDGAITELLDDERRALAAVVLSRIDGLPDHPPDPRSQLR